MNRNQKLTDELEAQVLNLKARVDSMERSLSWRVTSPLRHFGALVLRAASSFTVLRIVYSLFEKIRQLGGLWASASLCASLVKSSGLRPTAAILWQVLKSTRSQEPWSNLTYSNWASQFATPTNSEIRRLKKGLKRAPLSPLISIVLPTYDSDLNYLQKAVMSVLKQSYKKWELCVVDDASSSSSLITYLTELATVDSRIKVVFRSVNGHISAASNSGIEASSGDFLTFLDHDDELATDALLTFVSELNKNNDLVFAYSDEDKIDEYGVRSEPHFKPDFNETLATAYNYFCHMSFYKSSLVKDLGGLRSEFDGAQDYDLALRVIQSCSAEQIVHIPKILYHWRKTEISTASSLGNKAYAQSAGLRAVSSYLDEVAPTAKAMPNPELPQYTRVIYSVQGNPKVTIIIPTRDQSQILKVCIDSILKKTKYVNFEIVIVDNGSKESKTKKYLDSVQRDSRVVVVHYPHEFNYSKINNFAVGKTKSDYICLLNNDVEVVSPDWLYEMLSHAQRPGVGAVGARLWYPNGQLQHGGVVLGLGGVAGVAGHAHKYISRSDPGYMGRAKLAQEFSAVTAACLVVARESFELVGGLTEDLKVAFNDVDFCLKLVERGYRNVWTPFAELIHHESLSRGLDTTKIQIKRAAGEVLYMRNRWNKILDCDPAYNRNLTKNHEDFSLAWPPRLK